jgi:membrane fusion protein, multidrug efflux system
MPGPEEKAAPQKAAEDPKTKTQAQSAEQSKKLRRKRKRILAIFTLIFIVIALLWLLYYLCWGRFHEYTDDAYVDGNMVRLMPQIPGTVVAINTDDTQLVEEGQTIIKLDPADMRVALEKAQAGLALTVRKVRQYFDDATQANANVILRQADLDNAKLDLKRRQGLVGQRAISREEMEHYVTAVQTAQARFDYANAQLSSAYALIENTDFNNHPDIQRAKAVLRDAYLNFQRTTIVAPVTGFVAKRNVQVGQQVTPGTSMMAIVPLREIWINANYKESQLQRLRIGQDVSLTADAYDDGVTFHGKVQGLSAGTGSAFDLLPPQNATGNWIKIVQRLPVRIVLDADELKKHPLRIGFSVRVTTSTFGLEGSTLNSTPINHALYKTDVYESQLAEADKMITDIIRANTPVPANVPGIPS